MRCDAVAKSSSKADQVPQFKLAIRILPEQTGQDTMQALQKKRIPNKMGNKRVDEFKEVHTPFIAIIGAGRKKQT